MSLTAAKAKLNLLKARLELKQAEIDKLTMAFGEPLKLNRKPLSLRVKECNLDILRLQHCELRQETYSALGLGASCV